jgi:hypothetical protein
MCDGEEKKFWQLAKPERIELPHYTDFFLKAAA